MGGKAALDFGADWIKTVIVMATKSSYLLIMGKMAFHRFSVIFTQIFAKVAGIQDRCNIPDELKFQPDWIIHFCVMRP